MWISLKSDRLRGLLSAPGPEHLFGKIWYLNMPTLTDEKQARKLKSSSYDGMWYSDQWYFSDIGGIFHPPNNIWQTVLPWPACMFMSRCPSVGVSCLVLSCFSIFLHVQVRWHSMLARAKHHFLIRSFISPECRFYNLQSSFTLM